MAIKLDILAKQGILVAALTIAELIFLLVDGICGVFYHHCNLKTKFTAGYAEDYDERITNSEAKLIQWTGPVETHIHMELSLLVIYVVGIFVSALLIFGILKKHKNLIATWIVAYGLCAVAAVCGLIYSLIVGAATVTKVVRAVEIFNIACLALYPVVMLFLQMHREASQKKKQQIESQAVNVSSHPKFNPYFVQTIEK